MYYRVDSNEKYGELSHQKVEDLMVGARIDENEKKENPLDFTLWKKTDKGIQWDSPWSKGRPGWHTECVVMINDVFQKPLIDIHGGGLDLKFPHHENEIAQNESLHHTHLANMWVYNGMINIDGIKMSKSLGNVWWAKDLIALYGGNVIRWVMISAQYRAPLNLNEKAFESAQKELKKIFTAYKQAKILLQVNEESTTDATLDSGLWQPFIDALNDDLNTPNAITAVLECVKKINQTQRQKPLDCAALAAQTATLEKMMDVLGICLEFVHMTAEDKAVYRAWKEAVQEKNYEQADLYRAQLLEKGIL